MSLPVLIDPATAAAMAANSDRLLDMGTSLLYQGVPAEIADTLADHINAVTLANELAWAHESDNPADRALHHAANQLKLWHLLQIDTLISPL